MKPSEVLDKAADIVVRDGWIQGAYYLETRAPNLHVEVADDEANKTAPCCQAGAITRAVSGRAWAPYWSIPDKGLFAEMRALCDKAHEYMSRYLGLGDNESYAYPIVWNDREGRTADEVVEALRGAAALAREAGE